MKMIMDNKTLDYFMVCIVVIIAMLTLALVTVNNSVEDLEEVLVFVNDKVENLEEIFIDGDFTNGEKVCTEWGKITKFKENYDGEIKEYGKCLGNSTTYTSPFGFCVENCWCNPSWEDCSIPRGVYHHPEMIKCDVYKWNEKGDCSKWIIEYRRDSE